MTLAYEIRSSGYFLQRHLDNRTWDSKEAEQERQLHSFLLQVYRVLTPYEQDTLCIYRWQD